MISRALVLVALLATPTRSADLASGEIYIEICRVAATEYGSGGDGRASIITGDDGTLTVHILRTVSADGEAEQLGTFCDFSAEPHRLVEAYLTPCYHCGFTLAVKDIEDLNRRYFDK